MPTHPTGPDYVERVRLSWEARYPDLDVRPIDLIGRITRISSLALARVEHQLEPSGIGRTELEVLSALARSDRPLRASEVTSVTGISGASTTKHTERLVKMGLVARERLERDGRVVLLSLTDAGRELVEREVPVRIAGERRLLDGLDDHELDVLTDLLRRITANAENDALP
ncbi:MAG: MarR family transcriptional regulator [Rhodococcus sp.]|uniref:MarR family winged helix-turn-helix transcriptional regulator n=1 Tax=Rhodococcus sp. TaxID=1831 RepID=UPI0016BBF2F7|nr:MarR family transcriptional regulator [Rhodococcus sp. (in: high G+C Gram-positive bacteria)]NLV81250.1 MarR family transcriptional regulator [Rhodococcus sp. (in: high G+C Gram-positive bacteria)]